MKIWQERLEKKEWRHGNKDFKRNDLYTQHLEETDKRISKPGYAEFGWLRNAQLKAEQRNEWQCRAVEPAWRGKSQRTRDMFAVIKLWL